jgi:hypothetical protein
MSSPAHAGAIIEGGVGLAFALGDERRLHRRCAVLGALVEGSVLAIGVRRAGVTIKSIIGEFPRGAENRLGKG